MAVSGRDFEDALALHFPRGLREGVPDKPAGARWATVEEATSPNWRFESQPGMMFLGYRGDTRIGRRDDRHQITIAGSRAGKGVSLIVPTLLTYEGSVVAIDPKGELARLTAKARHRMGQKVYILDPFGVSGEPSACFNPLAEIAPDSSLAIDDALVIANALVTPSQNDPYWGEAAQTLVQALILLVLPLMKQGGDLITMRDHLMLRDRAVLREAAKPEDREAALLKLMAAEEQLANGVIAGIAAQFMSMGDKERGAVLSTARTQTNFLDSPALGRVMRSSDFAIEDVKRKPTTLYLCLPASNMATHAKWLRVMVSQALRACERVRETPPLPVLFVLDEFAVLGHMRDIEAAAGQMAGFGVKLWVVLQDLSQLRNHYSNSWETFFGNAALATFHGIADMTTLEYLSKRLGKRSFKVDVGAGPNLSGVVHGQSLTKESMSGEPLLAPHEIELALARERGRLVVLFPGSHPIILRRTEYFSDPYFRERL